MNLIHELTRQKKLYVSCPNCEEEFRLGEARLFDATKTLPQFALSYLDEQRNLLKNERMELRRKENSSCISAQNYR